MAYLSNKATFVLIPGAGGQAFYWHRVVPELRRRGHDAVAVELPAASDAAGLENYVDVVVDAIGEHVDSGGSPSIVLVGQSMGGLTAPLVADRVSVDLLVLLNAMIPLPGETGGDWWGNTGQHQARVEQAAREGWPEPADDDFMDAFFHDVPGAVLEAVLAKGEPIQSGTPFGDPWPLAEWPAVATKVLQGRDDRFFPIEFQRRLARERLGLEVDEMPGGHLVALSQPIELADRLVEYWKSAAIAPGSAGAEETKWRQIDVAEPQGENEASGQNDHDG